VKRETMSKDNMVSLSSIVTSVMLFFMSVELLTELNLLNLLKSVELLTELNLIESNL
jgi:hypothetical protein